MEWIQDWIAGLGAAGCAVAAAGAAWRYRAPRVQASLAAAKAAGLTAVVRRGKIRPRVSGRSGPLAVHLENSWIEHGGMRILVEGFRFGPGKPSLDGEGLIRHLRDGEVDQYDLAELDRAGQGGLALAILGAEARRRLGGLLHGYEAAGPVQVSATLIAGRLAVQLRGSGTISEDVIQATLESVLGIAHRLVLPDDLAQRLAENLRNEPETPLYLRTLELLDREPHQPATRKALFTACRHPSSAVRLQAAEALGGEGDETLLALLTGAADDSTRVGAIRAFGDRLPVEQAEAALRRALAWQQDLTTRACLAALERLDCPVSEDLLLQALGSEDAPSVAAAARCLGRVGSIAAVGPLREVEASWRGEPGSAAHRAVLEIQARLIGAEAGQLTLAGGEAGALSLAPGEPGRLSFSKEDEPNEPGAAPSRPPPAARTS